MNLSYSNLFYPPSGLRSKLLVSHLSTAAIGLVALIIALTGMIKFKTTVDILVFDKGPRAQNATFAMTGIQQSLAGLRGWVALGRPGFLHERKEAWDTRIWPAITRLQSLEDGEEDSKLLELVHILKKLERSQWWVEDVARTPGNVPAQVLLQWDARSVFSSVMSLIDAMIGEEKKLMREAGANIVEWMLSNLKASLRIGFLGLHDFVKDGEEEVESEIIDSLVTSGDRLRVIYSQPELFNRVQAETLELLRNEFFAYKDLMRQVIVLRKSESWNVALYLMAKETVPLSTRAVKELGVLSSVYVKNMEEVAMRSAAMSNSIVAILAFLIMVMVIAAIVMSNFNSDRIARPILRLSEAAKAVGAGNLDARTPVTTRDEVGVLSLRFNSMVQSIQNQQRKLALLNKNLEQRVLQRTADLTSANADLKDFAHVVSHDIKAPLRAIHNYSDFLKEDLEGKIEEQQKMYLDGLMDSVRQSEEFIDSFLELAGIGRHDMIGRNINMGLFLRGLITSLNLPADVKIVMRDDWPSLNTEPTLIRQIFLNLITNAVTYNRSSPKLIEIGWHAMDEGHYELFVKDNGIGVEPRFFEQILLPFQRLHTREELEGSGIGLAIVMKAAGRLQGRVRVESKSSEGSTFFVELPEKLTINNQEE